MGGGGPNSQQAHDVVTSFRRRVPIRFLISQCQIITFLILIYDNIENSRIELRGIVLPVQMGGLLGGTKGYVGPPLSNYWGGLAPPPPPWPPLFLRLCKVDGYTFSGSNSVIFIYVSLLKRCLPSKERICSSWSKFFPLSCCCCVVIYVHGKHPRSCRDGQLT